jgi:hypothetical protein
MSVVSSTKYMAGRLADEPRVVGETGAIPFDIPGAELVAIHQHMTPSGLSDRGLRCRKISTSVVVAPGCGARGLP